MVQRIVGTGKRSGATEFPRHSHFLTLTHSPSSLYLLERRASFLLPTSSMRVGLARNVRLVSPKIRDLLPSSDVVDSDNGLSTRMEGMSSSGPVSTGPRSLKAMGAV
jgi:hypothetical protein